MRKLILLALLAAALPASAATNNACWNRGLTMLETLAQPPDRGDQAFFNSVSTHGQVTMLFTTNQRMKGFSVPLYSIRVDLQKDGVAYTKSLGDTTDPNWGCNNWYLDNVNYFLQDDPISTTSSSVPKAVSTLTGAYDSSKTYPDVIQESLPMIKSAWQGWQGHGVDGITSASAYRYPNLPYDGNDHGETVATACSTMATNSTLGLMASLTFTTQCAKCLNSKGYFLNPFVTPPAGVSASDAADRSTGDGSAAFLGNYLRFFPNKALMMFVIEKRIINQSNIANIRKTTMTFDSGGNGANQIIKYLPQGQCTPPNPPAQTEDTAMNSASFSTTSNQIAELLSNAGYYNSNQTDWHTLVGGSGADWIDIGKPYCGGCSSAFFVLLTDGRTDVGNKLCSTNSDPTKDSLKRAGSPCVQYNQCTSGGLGTEADGDNYVTSQMLSNATSAGYTHDNLLCDKDYAGEVAYFLAHNDFGASTSSPGDTPIIYVIGMGPDPQFGPGSDYNRLEVAREVAKAGNGKIFYATDFKSLYNAIQSVLQAIISSTTSFSVAAITTVQTRGTTYAFIPRFKPENSSQWAGKLYRFNLFNEFAAGCTSSDYTHQTTNNPDGDSSCSEIYLEDRDGGFVGENDAGDFILLNTSTLVGDGGINGLPWPAYSPARFANPVWEASSVLADRVTYNLGGLRDGGITEPPGGSQLTAARNIWTVYQNSSATDYDTALTIDDSSNSLSVLTTNDLFDLRGKDSVYCAQFAAQTLHTYTTDQDCVKDLVHFIMGWDIFHVATTSATLSDGGTTSVNIDVNSSTGAPIEPPLYARPKVLGDIFHSSPILVTAPVATFLCDLGVANQCMYSLYSPQLSTSAGTDGGTAYDQYVATQGSRDQFVIVGANDGMIHAFRAACADCGAAGSDVHDNGDGQEMWAFIPPDLLPKLKYYALSGSHQIFVDGTPMVRDVWVDGTDIDGGSTPSTLDYKKQSSEFHTVAIVGEREGGRHYVALDITKPYNPRFLWIWPKPGTGQDLAMGETWNDHSPAPPPIGPVAIKDTNGLFSVNGVKAKEEWIVALNGGYDPDGLRGRGVWILDAWTGAEIFRFWQQDNSVDTTTAKLAMVPGPPSLLDTNSDALFDAMAFSDTQGQVWMVDMSSPGDTSSGRVTNWHGGRAFQQFKSGNYSTKSPFFSIASAAQLANGDIRVFVGAGTRDNVRDLDGGTCSIDDLQACERQGCQVVVTASPQPDAGTFVGTGSSGHYATASWNVNAATLTTSSAWDTASQSNACSDSFKSGITYSVTCNSTTTTANNYAVCDFASTDAPCPVASGKPTPTAISSTWSTWQNSRFYSIKLYENSGNRSRPSDADAGSTYDTNRLTDTDLGSLDTDGGVANSNGWYLTYGNADEKTASGALVLAGCVLWNTLVPGSTAAGCSTLPNDTANLYQADATTGSISCGSFTSTTRYTTRSTIVPPPMPTPVVSVNEQSGQIQYSGVSLDPRHAPVKINVGGGDVIGTISWLELSRETHNCRHTTLADGGTNCQ